MRTRDVITWHYSARDLAELALLAAAGAALLLAQRAVDRLERWIDERGERS